MNQHRNNMKKRMIGFIATGGAIVAATLMVVAGPVGATVGVTPASRARCCSWPQAAGANRKCRRLKTLCAS